MTAMIWYISSAYVISSSVLFLFPNLIRTKASPTNPIIAQALSTSQPKMLRISHRGSPRYSTQNTIQGFRKIFHISDCLQMDVCETADQVLVLHHDKNLLRSCGVDKDIRQVKYDELPKYRDNIKIDFAAERYMVTNNERIPKLQSIFQIFQGMPMDIQLKTPTQTAIKQFIKLINKYERQDHTIIGIRGNQSIYISKQYQALTKDLQPSGHKILTFMNDKTVIKLYLSYITGLLPFLQIKDSSLQIPIYSKQFQQWCVNRAKSNNQSQLKIKIGCQVLKLMNFISKPLIWHLKKRGVITFGWVCNTNEAMERAAWMGVQGIMSDEPYELDKFAKQWQGKQQPINKKE